MSKKQSKLTPIKPEILPQKIDPKCPPGRRPLKFTASMAITRNMFSTCLQRSSENKKELRGLTRKQFYEYFKGPDGPGYSAPPETVQVFLDMFDSLDREGKNLVSISDVLHFFYPLSSPKELEQRRQMIKEFDESIQTENYTTQHDKKRKKLNESRISELVDAFKVYDRDGSGKLMLDAFATAVQDIWEHQPSKSEVRDYFASADPSNKGYITATDWVNWLQQTTYVTLEDLSKGLCHRFELLQDSDVQLPNELHHSSAPPSPGRSQSVPGRPRKLSLLISPPPPPPPSSCCPSVGEPRPDASHQRYTHSGHSGSRPAAACRSAANAAARHEQASGIVRARPALPTMSSWRGSLNATAGGGGPGPPDGLGSTPGHRRHSGRLTASMAAGPELHLGRPWLAPRQRCESAALARTSPRFRGEVTVGGPARVRSLGPPFHPDFLSLGIVRRCADLGMLARAAPSCRARSAPAPAEGGDSVRADVARPDSRLQGGGPKVYLPPPASR
jgi:Ca2+-binding EF-hand superfamily protein